MAKTHRLYKSDMLDATYREGSSPWTLVLFESAAFIGEPGEHPRRAFLQAADITAVVISAKQRNWYPLVYMADCLKAIRPVLARASVVTLGASMGGYAAIKYARDVGAERAIALSPQFSLDPAFTLAGDPFQGSFRRKLHAGMEIKAGDSICPVDILLDPVDRFDREHGRLISHAVPCRITNVPYSGHALEVLFSGPAALPEIIGAFMDDNYAEVMRLVRHYKRHSVYYFERLHQRLRDRKPMTARRVLDTALTLPVAGTDNRVSRSLLLTKVGRPDVAASELRAAFNRASNVSSLQTLAHAMSTALAAMGQWSESATWTKKVLEYVPQGDEGAARGYLPGYALRLVNAGLYAEAELILPDLLRRSAAPSLLYALSVMRRAQGRFADALDAARQANAANPNNANIRGHLARLLLEAEHPEEAEKLHTAAVATIGDSGSWFEWSKFLHARSRTNEALTAVQHAIRLAPSNVPMRNHLAALLMQDGAFEAALDVCQVSVDIWTGDGSCWMQMGTILERMGRQQEAVAAMTRATVKEPASADHWAGLINLLLRLDDVEGASKAAEQAYGSPCMRTPALLLAHAKLCVRVLKINEAIDDARQAIILAPEDPGHRGVLANYLLQADQAAEAVAEAGHAVRQAPGAVWLRRILLSALDRCGLAEEALCSVRNAVAANPANAEFREMLASRLLQRGDVQEAGVAIAAALETGLESAPLWELHAQVQQQNGDVNGSVEAMRRAVVLAPDNPQHLGALANYLLQDGSPAEAVKAAREAVRLAPEARLLRHTLLTALTQSGQTDDALDIYRDALAANSADADLRATIASLMLKSGRGAEAAEVIASAKAAGLQSASMHEAEASMLLKRGDNHGATAAMRCAVALAPDHAGFNGVLANCLIAIGDYVQAETAARAAIRLKPHVAWFHSALSVALRQQGKEGLLF